MKKFLGILVALTLCVCLLAPSAMAADTSALDEILAGLSDVDLSVLENLSDSDIASVLRINSSQVDAVKDKIGLGTNSSTPVVGALADSSTGEGSILDTITSMFGNIDLDGLTDMIPEDVVTTIMSMFEGVTGGTGSDGGFDVSGLLDTITGAFSGEGFDLGSLTEGFDLGSFDVSSILGGLGDIGGSIGGGDSSDDSAGGSSSGGGGIMDTMSSLADKLMSGLESLGLDTSKIEGLLDNDIVNFFANLYIGLGEVLKPSDDETPSETTTSAPAVVTTKPPKTGDTSAVIAAIATISVASAAAFVCLKKKED